METIIKSDRLYDRAKFVALVVLPAVATLYLSLAGLWGLPYRDQVVGTITAFDTLLGALLGLSSKSYSDGTIEVEQTVDNDDNEMTLFNMSFEDGELKHLADKKRIVFKVDSK